MFQDETRCGRMNDPRACWAPRSVRPLVGAQVVRELVDAFGATSPFDGCHDSLILTDANVPAMTSFLDKRLRRHPGEYLLVLMDQAG